MADTPQTAYDNDSPAADSTEAPVEESRPDKQQRREEREKLLQTLLAEVAQLKHQIPGMITRIASEQFDKRASKSGESDARGQKPDLQAQLDALSGELKKRDEIIATEKRANAVRAAVSGITWFNPEDAVREILPNVTEKDGRLLVPGVEKLADQEISREFPLDEAVRNLAKKKPYLVRASIQTGSGATGGLPGSAGSSGLKDQITKWSQVKDDPVLLARLQAENPAYAESLQFKYIEKQKRRQQKQGF